MFFALDFRQAASGGAVVPARLIAPGGTLDQLQGCSSVTFLVHGFNVDRSGGEKELEKLAGLLPCTFPGAAVAVLWPGDSSWSGPLCYPFVTNNADDTAVELTRFIADWLPQQARISLVAHSLGCRVAMQTARHLWIEDRAVDQICLLAGALDNDSLADKALYLDASLHASRVAVLYSPGDQVLRDAYPLGNLLAAFLRFSSTHDAALGYTGPRACDHDAVPVTVAPVGIDRSRGVDHGDYLPSADGAPSAKQLAAAAFVDAVLSGTLPLRYGPTVLEERIPRFVAADIQAAASLS